VAEGKGRKGLKGHKGPKGSGKSIHKNGFLKSGPENGIFAWGCDGDEAEIPLNKGLHSINKFPKSKESFPVEGAVDFS
jgi:hypothetical protein